MRLGIVQNPSLFETYLGQWSTNKHTRSNGFAVLKASKYVCAACGVQSPPTSEQLDGWMVPVDLQHPAFAVRDPKKGITLCPVCVAGQALNWSLQGVRPKGRLIRLPAGLGQAELSRLAVACGAFQGGDDILGVGVQVVSSLESAIQQLANELTYEPGYQACVDGVDRGDGDFEFAQTLALLTPDAYSKRDQIIENIGFWPDMQEFDGFFEYILDNAPAFKFEMLKEKIEQLSGASATQQSAEEEDES